MSKTVALAAAVAALLPISQVQASQGVTVDQHGRLLVGGQDISVILGSTSESDQQARPTGGANYGCEIPLAARPTGGANYGCEIPLAARPTGGANYGCDIPA